MLVCATGAGQQPDAERPIAAMVAVHLAVKCGSECGTADVAIGNQLIRLTIVIVCG
jgi:hypothetical protein